MADLHDLAARATEAHDHKGYSEEKCLRCGWVMGMVPLNCDNDNTPHVFPSQAEALRQRDEALAALEAIAAEDDLVEANPSAFSMHAFRRCQAIAARALSASREQGAEE